MNTIVLKTNFFTDNNKLDYSDLIEKLNHDDNQRIEIEGSFYTSKERNKIVNFLQEKNKLIKYNYKVEVVFYSSSPNYYTLEQLKNNKSFYSFSTPTPGGLISNFNFYMNLTGLKNYNIAIPHNNPHHPAGVKEHMLLAEEYVSHNSIGNKNLYDSLLLLNSTYLHDIGKPLTKCYRDLKGNKTEIAHYWNHANIGAVISLCMPVPVEVEEFEKRFKWERAWLICHHMDFYNYPATWTNSQRIIRFKQKCKNDRLVRLLWELHEADMHCEDFLRERD